MRTRLAVDNQTGLTEYREPASPPQPFYVRLLANFFSYLFHPVFIPMYLVGYLLYVHPYLFAGTNPFNKTRILLMAVVMYVVFPVITVLLLKALKFIETIQLKTQKDRIIPMIACGIWYAWICYVWWNSHKMQDGLSIPKQAVQLALAIFLASWFALMANIKMKISLHAISMGVMLTFILLLAFSQELNFTLYIAVALLVTGITCTSRFIVSDHTPAEVYGGLVLGAGAMVIASQFG
jgi:hypothetical protein